MTKAIHSVRTQMSVWLNTEFFLSCSKDTRPWFTAPDCCFMDSRDEHSVAVSV